jgi:hypothetical protein
VQEVVQFGNFKRVPLQIVLLKGRVVGRTKMSPVSFSCSTNRLVVG